MSLSPGLNPSSEFSGSTETMGAVAYLFPPIVSETLCLLGPKILQLTLPNSQKLNTEDDELMFQTYRSHLYKLNALLPMEVLSMPDP